VVRERSEDTTHNMPDDARVRQTRGGALRDRCET
jgi:hypothetical protein